MHSNCHHHHHPPPVALCRLARPSLLASHVAWDPGGSALHGQPALPCPHLNSAVPRLAAVTTLSAPAHGADAPAGAAAFATGGDFEAAAPAFAFAGDFAEAAAASSRVSSFSASLRLVTSSSSWPPLAALSGDFGSLLTRARLERVPREVSSLDEVPRRLRRPALLSRLRRSLSRSRLLRSLPWLRPRLFLDLSRPRLRSLSDGDRRLSRLGDGLRRAAPSAAVRRFSSSVSKKDDMAD